MITDSGYFSAGVTESFTNATPIVNFFLGRSGSCPAATRKAATKSRRSPSVFAFGA
jgi:hypothetical protein